MPKPTVTVDLRDGTCTCGCGAKVPKRWAPGHDQRAKGQLTRAAKAGEQVTLVSPDGSKARTTPAEAAAHLDTAGFSWSGLVAKATP